MACQFKVGEEVHLRDLHPDFGNGVVALVDPVTGIVNVDFGKDGVYGHHATNLERRPITVPPAVADDPSPALIEAAYIAQDDLSKPPDRLTVEFTAEIINAYLDARDHDRVHVIGHPEGYVPQ
ncbi:hypothetical protein SEA_PUPPER_28 [Gordonia phage Pupper]|uniref:Uncharacterized protein n=1 Tax=Gordonia phage Pupper TaxID=2571249 RepID=A0A4Y6EKE8_9CAUD|nr:hypothetical protein KHQ83_gp028 [Gordonia phage Pupper]QDF18515.1 hypothetical protein SEA_PUPPER_28 [Gordonia phage Pupper]QDF18748.1 hypothetical protein SEA_SCENTAE_28 [Gordonia phage SCentae]